MAEIDLTTITPGEFEVQPISSSSVLAAAPQAKLNLTNMNARWTAIAFTFQKTTDADYPAWQYFSAPVPQNCSYPDGNQCVREKSGHQSGTSLVTSTSMLSF